MSNPSPERRRWITAPEEIEPRPEVFAIMPEYPTLTSTLLSDSSDKLQVLNWGFGAQSVNHTSQKIWILKTVLALGTDIRALTIIKGTQKGGTQSPFLELAPRGPVAKGCWGFYLLKSRRHFPLLSPSEYYTIPLSNK